LINLSFSDIINYPISIQLPNIETALNYCENNDNIESVFIIGGEQIYNTCFTNSYLFKKCLKIYWTIIPGIFDCDRFFHPPFNSIEEFTPDISNEGVETSSKRVVFIRN